MRIRLAVLLYHLGFNVDSGFLLDNWFYKTFCRLRCALFGHWKFSFDTMNGQHITRCNRCDLYVSEEQ